MNDYCFTKTAEPRRKGWDVQTEIAAPPAEHGVNVARYGWSSGLPVWAIGWEVYAISAVHTAIANVHPEWIAGFLA